MSAAEPDPRVAAEAWMKADMARPVDPAIGPLFGFALFKASAARFFWYARYHHIALDGYGMWLMSRRVAEIYTDLCAGRSSQAGAFGPMAPLLAADAAYRALPQFEQDRQYWDETLADRPEPGSLTLSHRPPIVSASFQRDSANLPRSTEAALRALAVSTRTSLARVMAAAAAIFLYRLTGTDDVVIGLPVAARDEVSRAIPGMASNVLPLRLSLRPDMTVAEVVAQASARIRQALPHQRYQLADMRRSASREALFGLSINVMPFDYGFSFAGHRGTAHNLSLGPVEDLSISVYDRSDDGALRVDFDVNPARHSAADLAIHRQRFLRLLTALADASRPIGNLAILNDIERDTIVERWNATAAPLPRLTVADLFAAQAARTPDATAVIFGERQLSYAALATAANRLAHHLRESRRRA